MAFRRAQYGPLGGYDPGDLTRRRVGEALARKAGLFPGDRVLDILSGPGLLTVNIARAFKRVTAIACDPNPEHLGLVHANAVREGARDRVRLVRAPGDALPFPDESFPLTVSAFQFHAMPLDEIADVMEEAHRVTMFMGKFLFVDADFRRAPQVRHVTENPFDEAVLDVMKDAGFRKISIQRLEMRADNVLVNLLLAKRFDPEEDEGDEDEEGEGEGEEE